MTDGDHLFDFRMLKQSMTSLADAGYMPSGEYVRGVMMAMANQAKGYWIAQLDVSDVDAYKAYVEANAEAFGKYGGRFLTRGGQFFQLEGKNRSRNVIIEFDSIEQAMRCYWSEEYQRAFRMRKGIAAADIIIMSGYTGVQPPILPGDQASVEKAL